jgi:hypothetical protein
MRSYPSTCTEVRAIDKTLQLAILWLSITFRHCNPLGASRLSIGAFLRDIEIAVSSPR